MITVQVADREWWRWVITLATFIQYFVVFGPLFNYSILFVSLQAEFQSGAAITGKQTYSMLIAPPGFCFHYLAFPVLSFCCRRIPA